MHIFMQITGINLRIQQLELETAQPERREAARARKKMTKDGQRYLSDSGKPDAEKIKYLEGVFADQVITLQTQVLALPDPRLLSLFGSNRSRNRLGLRTRSFP